VHERRGKDNLEPDRIDRLVYARNKALAPLQEQAKSGDAHAHGRRWESADSSSGEWFRSSSDRSGGDSATTTTTTTARGAGTAGAAADGRWVIFLNDIAFSWEGVALLLETPVRYDMVCGMDTQRAAPPLGPSYAHQRGAESLGGSELYDVWVSRDLDGKPLTRKSPHYTHPLDQGIDKRKH